MITKLTSISPLLFSGKPKTLKKGARYTYKITGVRVKGNQTYKTVTGTFIAK